ncbi:replication initiation factor domain-containing protein [Leptospira biflexa]|uniref:replication initiation factor domain-containing protein n=1 Tax=Leptospira biflexa TaxID=172 RepID=UPI001083F8D8|nr:replication initiation factor domain-containing protein [Leptospira biflexa]TGM30730.1 replication initiation factor [Leptospira biflexa]TGM34774.1 replication initiation factor [Leptospira biflexa]
MKFVPESFKKPFVDWLAFSLEYRKESFDWINKTFGEKALSYEKGMFGYSEAYQTTTQTLIAYSPEKPQNRIHVSLSSGALFRISENYTVQDIVRKAISLGGKFSRIDIAKDDYDGFLDMEEIFHKLSNGHVASRLRTFVEYRGNQTTQTIRSHKSFNSPLEEKKRHGHTIYIGDIKGRVFVRIYDKEGQMGKGYNHWVRVEFQLRHDAADMYCNPSKFLNIDEFGEILEDQKKKKDSIRVSVYEEREIERSLSSDFANRTFSKTAYYYLKFLEPSFKIRKFKESNILFPKHKRHWFVSPWWINFLETYKGESIGLPKNETGLEEIKAWALNSTSGADYLLTMLNGDSWKEEKEKVGEEKFYRNKKYQTLLKQKTKREEINT